jgi:hypothetical protein
VALTDAAAYGKACFPAALDDVTLDVETTREALAIKVQSIMY